jgi:hypothetical protein
MLVAVHDERERAVIRFFMNLAEEVVYEKVSFVLTLYSASVERCFAGDVLST